MMETATMTAVKPTPDDSSFDDLSRHVRATFAAAAGGDVRLFLVDADALFETYLDAMGQERQEHNCHACRRFLQRFGGLVTIDEEGRAKSALWNEGGAPAFYAPSVLALRKVVERAAVSGVFLDREQTWGMPVAGGRHHFAVSPPKALVHTSVVLSSGQAMAEKKEDYATVRRALVEFTLPMLEEACRVLDSDALYRPEKVAGPARWLRDLQSAYLKARGPARDNLVWRAVASAPPGYAHPRATMVGTLLEDIAAGLPYAEVSRRFAAKMHPLQYQRPQAAPTAGNIARAEKLVEQLGIAPSLERRFATVGEATALWKPAPAKPEAPAGGVFAHLKAKAAPQPSLDLPAATMTWAKFARDVVPSAEEIRVHVGTDPQSFMAILTAAHPDAPPILQWDATDRRNPASYYTYPSGSPPSQWTLRGGDYVPATAIVGHPAKWGQPEGSSKHFPDMVIFLLAGCRETRTGEGNALFPEFLKSELHEVRSTIEAHSKSAVIAKPPEGVEWACGLGFFAGQPWDAKVRVRSAGTWRDYRLDRWD